jgi:DNA repair protein RecO (recombination protein O)
MEERTSGIILRTRPFTETSLIVQWLTPDLGRIATVAKGAQRPKSPFLGRVDLFYEAKFSFIRSRKSELHTLKEVVLIETHAPLRRDFAALSLASYFTVLIELATETETPIPEICSLFGKALARVSKAPPDPTVLFKFETKFLKILGFEPQFQNSGLSSAAKKELSTLFTPQPVPQNPATFKELNRFFQSCIGRAFEKLPPQRLEIARLLGL